jgi:hypothetical protein
LVKRILLVLVLSVISLRAEEAGSGRKRLWKWSIGVLAAANAADVMTSMGRHELNPVLGVGQFGARATSVKISISAATIGVQYLLVRRRPQTMRKAAYINFALAGATGAVATFNTRH